MPGEKKAFCRLPATVVPTNYNVTLTPNLEEFTFKGAETVKVEVKVETDKIILNCADIEIQTVKFTGDGQEQVGTCSLDAEAETATLTFDKLPTGPGSLYVEFTGILNDKMKGFYRSKNTGPDGKDRYSAVTQFESTDARRAMPCWDEPAIKATFDVTLVVPKDRVALSNMPVVKEETKGDGLKSLTFDTTPIMSTYLLAFCVGEYDYVEARDSDDVLIRVYTPVGKSEQGKFALDVAVKTLPFYKEYFGIAYPLPKMDLIAFADFAAGAMENWGLVTYRETALLIDPANSSSAARQRVCLVVGHELAHQWFGNLVTMEWWTHLWLNEGFASFIEYYCVDHCFPEFDIWTQFVNQDLASALDLDALNSSHPIEVPVGHPAEVDEIFDAISYNKGASVIRMLHSWIGDQAFKTGLNKYLTKFSYKNTLTEDLWDALGAASGKPVREVMSTWTSQMGFPVLEVSERQEGDKRLVTVSQSKFCADGKQAEGYQWMVPISFTSQADPNATILSDVLKDKTCTYSIDVKPGHWVKMNPGTIGMYRVRYSTDMLDTLIPSIKQSTLPPRDRLGLQNDLFALARAGLSPCVDVLKVAQAFKAETNYTVWSDLSQNLASIGLLTQYTDFDNLFSQFNIALFSDISAKLGWEKKDGESPLDSMLRAVALGKIGRAGHKETIAQALEKFDAHHSGTAVLDADLRVAVYGIVLKHGPADYYDKLLELYGKAELSEERVRIQRTLGSVQDEAGIQKVLDFSLSDKVRSQDAVFCIGGVTGSAAGRELAWSFLKANWTRLCEMYQGGFLQARLVKMCTENFAQLDKIPDIEQFFMKNPAPAAERTIQQSIENIRLNAEMLARNSDSMRTYLQSQAQ